MYHICCMYYILSYYIVVIFEIRFFILCPNHSGLSFHVSNGVYKFLMNAVGRIQEEIQLLSTTDTLSEVY